MYVESWCETATSTWVIMWLSLLQSPTAQVEAVSGVVPNLSWKLQVDSLHGVYARYVATFHMTSIYTWYMRYRTGV